MESVGLSVFEATLVGIPMEERKLELSNVLLEAGEKVKANAQRDLTTLLQRGNLTENAVEEYLNRWGTECIKIEELVVRLREAEGTLYDAAFLRNCRLIKSMIESGLDVDSKNSAGKTVLFAAVELNSYALVKFLLTTGIDANATDMDGKTALFGAVSNKEMLHLLLEHGANPNIKANVTEETPLFRAIYSGSRTIDGLDCATLLMEYGAIPHNPVEGHLCTIFDHALNKNSAYILVAQLALLQRSGTSIDKSTVMRCKLQRNRKRLSELEDYFTTCEQVLETSVFGKLSLCTLLTSSDNELMRWVRNKTFVLRVETICAKLKLNESYSYYYNTLMKRVNKAADLLRLENIAIPTLCSFLHATGDEYYIAARKIVGYLTKLELELLDDL